MSFYDFVHQHRTSFKIFERHAYRYEYYAVLILVMINIWGHKRVEQREFQPAKMVCRILTIL